MMSTSYTSLATNTRGFEHRAYEGFGKHSRNENSLIEYLLAHRNQNYTLHIAFIHFCNNHYWILTHWNQNYTLHIAFIHFCNRLVRNDHSWNVFTVYPGTSTWVLEIGSMQWWNMVCYWSIYRNSKAIVVKFDNLLLQCFLKLFLNTESDGALLQCFLKLFLNTESDGAQTRESYSAKRYK